jgi:hypothetical protein
MSGVKSHKCNVLGVVITLARPTPEGSDVEYGYEMPDRSEFLQEAKRILDEKAAKLRPSRERGDETWIVIYNTEGLAMDPDVVRETVLSLLGPEHAHVDHVGVVRGSRYLPDRPCGDGGVVPCRWHSVGIEGVPSEKSSSFRPLSDHAQACSCQDRGLLPRLWRTTELEVARGPRTPTGPPGRRVMVERVNERSAQWKRELTRMLYKRGLRPTRLRQGPLPHRAGRGLLIGLTTDTSGGR